MAKKERLYTVRMSYDIVLKATDERDAITSVHYVSLYNAEITHLSQSVIDTKEIEPEVVESVSSVYDAGYGEQQLKDSNASAFRDPAAASDIPY